MKSANAQLIADLQEQVQRAEQASEQYRKQLEGMQQRLDEAASEQTASEERDYQRQTELDLLRAEMKESTRQRREIELAFEEDKQVFLQVREKQANKEAELQAVIGRLNEALRTRGAERINASRSGMSVLTPNVPKTNELVASMAESQLPTGSVDEDCSARNYQTPDYLQIMQKKEDAIEALRLDLAEAQLKLAEQEHRGDGRLQSLEKAIMEIKMQNARLVEENESFQMLLSEKTLKGDFMSYHHAHEEVSGMSTLAEELESTGEETDNQCEACKKREAEIKSLREEVKALRLYSDKIVGRILARDGFEYLLHEQDEAPPPPAKHSITEKALPATPDQQAPAQAATGPTVASTAAGVATGLLQRARSVVARPGARARPMSYAQPAGTPPAAAASSANENPETAPSIPLHRGHRRARSDQAQTDLAAAAVVQQMNRGSPMRTVSGGPMSPGLRPLSPPYSQGRGSYFGATSSTSRAPSGAGTRGGSSADSVTSDHSDEQRSNTDGSSTAAQMGGPGPGQGQGQNNIPGAVMKQNQLRPLRLVQEQTATEEEMKRNNRQSWIGWLRGSSIETQQD